MNFQNQNYYSRKSDKVIDFLIGYIGFFIIGFVLYYFIFFAGSTSRISSSLIGLFWIIIIMFPIVSLLLANLVLKKNRRYIAKGINFAVLSLILIPVIFFGACLISLNGYGR